MTNGHKQAKDENFPVGLMMNKHLKPLVQTYYQAARAADDIADTPTLTAEEKLKILDQMERAFYTGKNTEGYPFAVELGQKFATENLDASLYTDLLKAFRKDALNHPLEIWEQLIDYCTYSAAPVGRFLLAIHNENPSTYLPAAALCTVLQISNHIQDLKKDTTTLKRFYIPRQMMNKYGVTYDDFFQNQSSPELKALICEIIVEMRRLLKDAASLPRLIKDKRLKIETGIILSLTNSMLKRLEKGDILNSHIRLSPFDWIKALGYGFRTLFI